MTNKTDTKHRAFALNLHATIEDGEPLVHITASDLEFEQGYFLKKAYESIGCETVDCVAGEIQGHAIDIWVDDYGLFAEADPALSADGKNRIAGWAVGFDSGRKQPLAGNLVITASDDEGETISAPIDEPTLRSWIESGRLIPIGIPV